METGARLARGGSRLLGFFAAILMLTMLAYGAFSLWNNWIVDHQAFGTDYLKFKPDPLDTTNLKELEALNPDVRGWLTIDGTHIDYPLVQGEFDYEYLNKDVYGKYVLSGSIFMSTTNAKDFSDPYTLVYGHHLDNGSMFGDIDKYMDEDFFDKNTTGTLYTTDSTYRIDLFACISADAYDQMVYSQQSQVTDDLPGMVQYLKEMTERKPEELTESASSTQADASAAGGDQSLKDPGTQETAQPDGDGTALLRTADQADDTSARDEALAAAQAMYQGDGSTHTLSAGHFRDLGIQNGDHIIGLSTCADAVTNGRYILFGKLSVMNYEELVRTVDTEAS